MECCNYDSRKFFLFGMRIFFGLWLLYVGMVKWVVIGPDAFVGHITSEFSKTWSPHLLNMLLAWLIIITEPLLAIFILLGKRPRLTWLATACLMFLLTMGQTILMKPDVIANWEYLVLVLVCAAMSDPDPCCSKSQN